MLNYRHDRYIRHEIRRLARANGVRVYKFANVGNHLHLLIRFGNRIAFQRFLRTLSGLVARKVTGARKGNPVGKFWDKLAFSRIVRFGKDFMGVCDYIELNEMEAQEVWSRNWDPRRRKSRPPA